MADWKQITARIRRARTGKDPAAQLSTLFEKTQDAMVAFELARVFETASQNAEAAKWYSTAAARFRRADYRARKRKMVLEISGTEVADELGRRHREKVAQAQDNPFGWDACVAVCAFSSRGHRVPGCSRCGRSLQAAMTVIIPSPS